MLFNRSHRLGPFTGLMFCLQFVYTRRPVFSSLALGPIGFTGSLHYLCHVNMIHSRFSSIIYSCHGSSDSMAGQAYRLMSPLDLQYLLYVIRFTSLKLWWLSQYLALIFHLYSVRISSINDGVVVSMFASSYLRSIFRSDINNDADESTNQSWCCCMLWFVLVFFLIQ